MVPFVFALLTLLSDKCATTYYKLFTLLHDAGFIFDPKFIFSDSESGLIEAVRNQFLGTILCGCHFHFTQAVWRKVQHLGLVTAYNNTNTPEISEFVQFMALAYIPEARIETEFEACINILAPEHLNILRDFINYFRDTWVRGLYKRPMWNKYDADHLHRISDRERCGIRKKLNNYSHLFFISMLFFNKRIHVVWLSLIILSIYITNKHNKKEIRGFHPKLTVEDSALN